MKPGMRMKAKALVIAVTVISLAAAAATAVQAFGGGSGASRTLRLNVRFSPLSVVDLPPKGYSRGDEIVSNDTFYDLAGKRAGYDSGACTLTSTQPLQAECTFTFVLGGGTLTGQFSNAPPPVKHVAITGGTGSYSGARGTAVIVESAKSQGGTATFTIQR